MIHVTVVRFRRWSRKRYASFCSLGRQVTIGTLSADIADASLRKNRLGISDMSGFENVRHMGKYGGEDDLEEQNVDVLSPEFQNACVCRMAIPYVRESFYAKSGLSVKAEGRRSYNSIFNHKITNSNIAGRMELSFPPAAIRFMNMNSHGRRVGTKSPLRRVDYAGRGMAIG